MNKIAKKNFKVIYAVTATVCIFTIMIPVSLFARKTYTEFREILPMDRDRKKGPYRYLKRKAYPWKNFGRIIGLITHPPKEYKIKIFAAGDTKPLRVEKHSGDLSVYETRWLRPGRYTIVFSAKGYRDCTVKGVRVKKFSDVLLNIEFGTHVYQYRLH